MKRGLSMIGLLCGAFLLLVLAGCSCSKQVKLAGVYVSFETQGSLTKTPEVIGPYKVKRLVLEPDMAALYYYDGYTEIYPMDPKYMKWFRWSANPE